MVFMGHPEDRSPVLLCPSRWDCSCAVRNPQVPLWALGEVLRIGWACGAAQEAGFIPVFQIFGLRPGRSDNSPILM